MNQPERRKAGRPTFDEAARKQHRLIVTALEEFAQIGFHGASLRTIAEKAQVSSRTLYNHYPDKLALFEACLAHSGRQIMPLSPHFKGSVRERLVDYAVAVQALLSAPQARQIAVLIFREAACFTELRRIAQDQFDRNQVRPLAKILETCGVGANRRHLLAKQFAVMACGEWQSRLLFGGPEMTPTEMQTHAELVTDIFLSGIGAETASGRSPAAA
jgi:AcrR family transcriptional regulator